MRLDDQKVNNLVFFYQGGDKQSLDDLCKTLLPLIESHSESIWHKVRNNVDFECRCLLKIKRAAKKFNPSKGNFMSLVMSIITKEKSDFLNRRKSRESTSVETLAGFDDKENYDIPDVLADFQDEVDERISSNEKVAMLLAKHNDIKERKVFDCWIEGKNDSQAAKTLADEFGGTFNGNYSIVRRLRTKCKKVVFS